MERVTDIMTNAITSLCNGSWQKNYELFIFNIHNPTETEREIIECVKTNFSEFIVKYSDEIQMLKSTTEKPIDNIGLLWFSYCDEIDLFEKLNIIAHRPRILTI